MFRKREKDFFEEFERDIQELNSIIESMMNKGEPMVYGFSMHVRNGVPYVQHFGNFRPMGISMAEENAMIEPFTSSIVDEKNNELNITSEMPGIKKEDIRVDATESEVTIKVEAQGRRYHKSIKTPCLIDRGSAKAKYNNGVLEVTLKLKEPYKGKQVKIE